MTDKNVEEIKEQIKKELIEATKDFIGKPINEYTLHELKTIIIEGIIS